MKSIYYPALLFAFIGLFSCKGNEAQPTEVGLPGTWTMITREAFIGNKWVSQPIPSATPSTIIFTNPSQLTSFVQNDTTLSSATYFELGGGGSGIIGPFILLKKSPNARTGKYFYYTLTKGSLRLSEFGQTEPYVQYQYSFSRF